MLWKRQKNPSNKANYLKTTPMHYRFPASPVVRPLEGILAKSMRVSLSRVLPLVSPLATSRCASAQVTLGVTSGGGGGWFHLPECESEFPG